MKGKLNTDGITQIKMKRIREDAFYQKRSIVKSTIIQYIVRQLDTRQNIYLNMM